MNDGKARIKWKSERKWEEPFHRQREDSDGPRRRRVAGAGLWSDETRS